MGIVAAIDLGTSGFRAEAIDPGTKEVVACVYTTCHPVPGSDLIDHVLFAMAFGTDTAHHMVVRTVNDLLFHLPGDIELLAVCGNPVQLSLLEGIETADLALGADCLERKGIIPPDRSAKRVDCGAIGIHSPCDVLIPPSIKAGVGADAIAMIMKSGMLGSSRSLAIDIGTNAEIALKSGSRLLVGSAAAGPAIEGRHIGHGMLAAPGAVADVTFDWGWRNVVLDERLVPVSGDIVALDTGKVTKKGPVRATGITGTGVISLVSTALAAGYADPPHIMTPSRRLYLQDGIEFTEADLAEAGKALGAFRAGQMALAEHTGIPLDRVDNCYAAGAAGSLMDPLKARRVGVVPACTSRAFLLGNTSLDMAGSLALGEESLKRMQGVADMAEHVDFTTSGAFKRHYVRELAYWCEGARYGSESQGPVMDIVKMDNKRRPENITFLTPEYYKPSCAGICPYGALRPAGGHFKVDLKKCRGASCLRCERC